MLPSRIYAIAIFTMLCVQAAHAQTKQKLDIKHVTVFLNGAELTSKAEIKLPAGETEILFTNVAGNINQQSLNVGVTNGVVVQSAIFQNNYLTDKVLSPLAQQLKDSIQLLADVRNDIYYNQQVAEQQINILNANQELYGEQTGVSVTELQKMLDLIKTRLKGLLEDKTKYTIQLTKMDQRIQKMQQQLREEEQKDEQPGGQVLVKFYAQRATSTSATITYVAPNAGWVPSYDIRVANINAPIDLGYKAHVHQNTGIPWEKVALTLSGGNPNEGAQAPVLSPWHVSLYKRPTPVIPGSQTKTSEEIQNMPTRNVASVASTAPGVYQSGARDDGTLYIIDDVQTRGGGNANKQSSIDRYTQVDIRGINTSFDIDIPYTIPSDGQTHNVAIKNYQLPATYRYYTIPKMDKDVFLQAQVTDWEDLNLLSGSTSVFFENTYIGQGRIDMKNIEDTMNISLGRDKKIIVTREQDKELRSVKTIGSKVRETFAYKISIRNTRKENAHIVVMDQIPISNNSDIDIEDVVSDGATIEKEKGFVIWNLNINPNENKELKLEYTVKYPKGERVNNL